MKRAAGFAARHPGAAGIVLGLASGAVVLALAAHFDGTRNRAGDAAVAAVVVLLVLACDLAGPRGRRLRDAAATLAAAAVTGAVLGGVYWILGRHWSRPAEYAAGVALAAAISLVMLAVGRVRRRLYWRRYGYSPQERREHARAGALWRRR